jgi:hypothetical protein
MEAEGMLPRTVAPLLALSDERIAREARRAEAAAELAAAWRRRTARFVVRCVSLYSLGILLCFSSFGLTGDAAEIALWSGLLLAEAAVFVFLFTFWAQSLE